MNWRPSSILHNKLFNILNFKTAIQAFLFYFIFVGHLGKPSNFVLNVTGHKNKNDQSLELLTILKPASSEKNCKGKS